MPGPRAGLQEGLRCFSGEALRPDETWAFWEGQEAVQSYRIDLLGHGEQGARISGEPCPQAEDAASGNALWGDPPACVSSTRAAEHLRVRRSVEGWANLRPESPGKDLRLRVEGEVFGATVQPVLFLPVSLARGGQTEGGDWLQHAAPCPPPPCRSCRPTPAPGSSVGSMPSPPSLPAGSLRAGLT